MLGAVIGDIVGSTFEVENHRSKYFEFFSPKSRFTDDTVCTYAISKILEKENGNTDFDLDNISHQLRSYCLPYIKRGFGTMFYNWLTSCKNIPYNSFGNGALMRISPAVSYGIKHNLSIDEIKKVAKQLTVITHSHPTALEYVDYYVDLLYTAHHKNREELLSLISELRKNEKIENYEIQWYINNNEFDLTCKRSLSIVCKSIEVSEGFEDCLSNIVSCGGDSDTYCAIAGPIAQKIWLSNEEEDSYKEQLKVFFKEYDRDMFEHIKSNF